MANLNLSKEKLQALRSEYRHRNVRGKYPRQKMLPEYRDLYPWVLPDEVDPYFAFCTICECRLSAKRSDLGKHEGSIKHTENAAKKAKYGMILKGCPPAAQEGEKSEQADEDTDEEAPYIKQEPITDHKEHSNSELNFDEPNRHGSTTAQLNFDGNENLNKESAHSKENGVVDDEADGGDDEEDDEDDDEDDDYDVEYVPSTKRRCSETDSQSQHSSVLDYLPVHVTINEPNNVHQLFSIREIPTISSYATSNAPNTLPTAGGVPLNYPTTQSVAALNAPQTPCKITIKKIPHPLAASTPAQVTTTATITPVPAAITVSQQCPQPSGVNGLQAHLSQQTHATATSSATMAFSTPPQSLGIQPAITVRDPFDLFFDSICASVKSLPPKLATEGKIRVMQLIGELEMRAITEREREQENVASANEANGGKNGVAVQQNATVASTTK